METAQGASTVALPTVPERSGDSATARALRTLSQAIVPRMKLRNKPPKRRRRDPAALHDKPGAAGGARAWVCISPSGESSVVKADKSNLSEQLGIQQRDLRLLESALSNQAPVIFTRERAIVVSVLYIRAIITTTSVYLVNPDDEASINFMAELKRRLAAPLRASKSAAKLGGANATSTGGGPPSASSTSGGGALSASQIQHHTIASAVAAAAGGPSSSSGTNTNTTTSSGGGVGGWAKGGWRPPSMFVRQNSANLNVTVDTSAQGKEISAAHGAPVELQGPAEAQFPLPFELQVLEVVLDELTCDLDDRALWLESTAYPAVNAMTEQPTPTVLERVRRVKNTLVRQTQVIAQLKGVLEALLDDDRDMHDMNLSAKAEQRAVAEEAAAAALEATRSALAAVQEEVEGQEGEVGDTDGSFNQQYNAVQQQYTAVQQEGGGTGDTTEGVDAIGGASFVGGDHARVMQDGLGGQGGYVDTWGSYHQGDVAELSQQGGGDDERPSPVTPRATPSAGVPARPQGPTTPLPQLPGPIAAAAMGIPDSTAATAAVSDADSPCGSPRAAAAGHAGPAVMTGITASAWAGGSTGSLQSMGHVQGSPARGRASTPTRRPGASSFHQQHSPFRDAAGIRPAPHLLGLGDSGAGRSGSPSRFGGGRAHSPARAGQGAGTGRTSAGSHWGSHITHHGPSHLGHTSPGPSHLGHTQHGSHLHHRSSSPGAVPHRDRAGVTNGERHHEPSHLSHKPRPPHQDGAHPTGSNIRSPGGHWLDSLDPSSMAVQLPLPPALQRGTDGGSAEGQRGSCGAAGDGGGADAGPGVTTTSPEPAPDTSVKIPAQVPQQQQQELPEQDPQHILPPVEDNDKPDHQHSLPFQQYGSGSDHHHHHHHHLTRRQHSHSHSHTQLMASPLGLGLATAPTSHSGREYTPLARLSRRSLATMSMRSGRTLSSLDSSILSDVWREEVQEVEMLLESYFMHIDNIYNRLKTLSEFIEDTEDLVNISLDAQRNRIISCDVCFSGINSMNGLLTALSGLMTVNLVHGEWAKDPRSWTEIVVIGLLVSYACFAALVAWYLKLGIMRFR